MTKTCKTIVFFGSGPVASRSLDFLADHFEIEAVVTKARAAHHKGIAPVEELVKKRGIKVLFANNRQELDALIDSKALKSDLAVVVDYGVIVSTKAIDYFPLGIVNSHFSLLPEWRGADPITFSILSGQKTTGVSLMLVAPELDTGDLIAQEPLHISLNETTPSLTEQLIGLSNDMLLKYLPDYCSGQVTPYPQPHADQATYSRKLTKSDSQIDWSKPASALEREVRAFQGWPGSRTEINSKVVIVTNAHVEDSQQDPLDISCGDGKYLSIDELIAPSGRKMNAKAFINGYLTNY